MINCDFKIKPDLGNLDDGMLTVQGKDIPIKAIVEALHEQFLRARAKALAQALAEKVIQTPCGRSATKKYDSTRDIRSGHLRRR